MVSLLPLFLLPFIVSTLYFQKFKIHPLFVLVCAPHYPFLFSPTLLPRWNSGMTTKTKSCREGHAGPASYGRCLSSIPEMYVSPFTILLCFFFFFWSFWWVCKYIWNKMQLRKNEKLDLFGYNFQKLRILWKNEKKDKRAWIKNCSLKCK